MADTDSAAKGGRPAYMLTPAEREYLSSGETGGYRESRLESQIKSKVADLGQRIDHLLSDVELLHERGFLDDDHWEDGWLQLMGFGDPEFQNDARSGLASRITESTEPEAEDIEQVVQYTQRWGYSWASSSPAEFARQLGRFANRTMLYPGEIEMDEVQRDMIWGFIQGLYLDHRPGGESRLDARRERFIEATEHAQQLAAQDIQADIEYEEFLQRMQHESEIGDRFRQGLRTRIREILEREGLDAKPFGWDRDLKPFQERRATSTLAEEVKDRQYSVSVEKVFNHLIARKIREKADGEPKRERNATDQWLLFTSYYSAQDTDPEEIIDRVDVLEVVDEHDLVAEGELTGYIHADRKRLEDEHWRGLPADAVVITIAEDGGSPTSAKVASTIGDVHKSQVTKLCTDLAGRETSRPVLAKDNGGWALTAYGELVAKALADQGGPSILRGTRTDDVSEVIDSAINEIGVNQWEYAQKD